MRRLLILAALIAGAVAVRSGGAVAVRSGGAVAVRPSAPPVAIAPTAWRYNQKGEVIVPMLFPVLGGAKWSDTWGAPRHRGARRHQGQDLPAPKMHPLVACFDGIWWGSTLQGDNGCTASYQHINNDTPHTDDGKGGEEFAWAPGIWPGTRVRAGQHIAYCGDSGNAEDTISHLHFELSVPGQGTVNAAASLRAATVLKATPRYVPEERPEVRPEASNELRVDGEVVSVDMGHGVAAIRVAAWANGAGKVTPQTRPARRWVRLSPNSGGTATLSSLQPGDFIALLGRDPGGGKAINARSLILLRENTYARQKRAVALTRTSRSSGTASSVSPGDDSAAAIVLQLTNQERDRAGAVPLSVDPILTRAAQAHAEDMAGQGYFSHTDRRGGRPWDRVLASGYSQQAEVGENIALGQRTPNEVLRSWIKSAGHRRNLLNPHYRAIGIGVARGTGRRLYWVQVFGTAVPAAVGEAEIARRGEGIGAPQVTPPRLSPIRFDFEQRDLDGWELSGDCWDARGGLSHRSYGGGRFSGVGGLYYLTSARPRRTGLIPDSGRGRALSPTFVISGDTIRFRIGGGVHPGRCSLNLLVEGEIVHTATGAGQDTLLPQEWDVSKLRGKLARLELRDDVATGPRGYIFVDDIEVSPP